MNVSKFKAKMIERNIKSSELADCLSIDISTFYRRLQNSKFTIEEVKKLKQKLLMTEEEAIEIFFRD